MKKKVIIRIEEMKMRKRRGYKWIEYRSFIKKIVKGKREGEKEKKVRIRKGKELYGIEIGKEVIKEKESWK